MGKHTLEAKNFTSQYYSANAVLERERAQRSAHAETVVVPSEHDIMPAAKLGTVTLEAFNSIAENFETKKPTLRKRLRKFGKATLDLLKSVSFEYPKAPKPLYTEAEKQAIFAADRVNAIVQAHTSIETAFAPAITNTVKGRVARTDHFDTPEDIADEDAVLKAQNKIMHGVSYQQQAEYAAALAAEEESQRANRPMVRLFTHDGAVAPLQPHEQFVSDFQKIARIRDLADTAKYLAENTPRDTDGHFKPAEELVGTTY